MIPDPIGPRVSIELGPRTPRSADGEPNRSGEGNSFEELFQAMLAPGAQPDSAAPKASEAVFERLDAAEMFNETGLFRGAAPLMAEGASGASEAADPRVPGADHRPQISAEAAAQVSLEPPPVAGPAPADTTPGIPATAAQQIALAGGSVPADMPTSREGLRTALSLRGLPPPPSSLRTAGADGEATIAGRKSQAAAALVQAFLAKSSSTASVQVSVRVVDGELSLVARADKLSREERDKLRIEIGALLARRGFAAGEIMVNGEALPAPEERKN